MEKETVNKAALVKKIQQKIEARDDYMTIEEINAFLTDVLETVTDTIKEDKDIRLVGFGKFKIRERSARKGRNPQTGEELVIPATRIVQFIAGKELKEAVPQRKATKKKPKKKTNK